jgi:hypothetical protein
LRNRERDRELRNRERGRDGETERGIGMERQREG